MQEPAQEAVTQGIDPIEELFRRSANLIPKMAWIARADGERVFFNDKWLQYHGAESH